MGREKLSEVLSYPEVLDVNGREIMEDDSVIRTHDSYMKKYSQIPEFMKFYPDTIPGRVVYIKKNGNIGVFLDISEACRQALFKRTGKHLPNWVVEIPASELIVTNPKTK